MGLKTEPGLNLWTFGYETHINDLPSEPS